MLFAADAVTWDSLTEFLALAPAAVVVAMESVVVAVEEEQLLEDRLMLAARKAHPSKGWSSLPSYPITRMN